MDFTLFIVCRGVVVMWKSEDNLKESVFSFYLWVLSIGFTS